MLIKDCGDDYYNVLIALPILFSSNKSGDCRFLSSERRITIIVGETYSKKVTVTEEMAATRAVEGVPHVYGTPSLVGLIEATAHEALKDEFELGQTSVGTSIELVHSSPTPIGMEVRCDVKLTSREGIFAHFEVEAFDAAGSICAAKHSRAIVVRDKIVATAEKKRNIVGK